MLFTCLMAVSPSKKEKISPVENSAARIFDTGCWTMIDIVKLIALHDGQSCTHALPHSLGDGHLYTHNKVFANVRDVVRAKGFVFSRRHTTLWNEYNVIPLLCLQSILDGGVVPYCDNVSPLRTVASRSARVDLPSSVARFLLGNLRRNFLLHESAHCIAHHVFQQIDSRGPRVDKKTLVLDNLFAESFANATETLAAALLETTAEKFFFKANSFMSFIPAVRDAALRLGSEYGPCGLFKILCFSYFLANLRYEEVTPEMSDGFVSLVLERGSLEEHNKQPLAVLFENSLKLNEKFREETAAVYFAFLGCQEEFAALYRFNIFHDPGRLSRYLDALNMMVDLVVSGVRFEQRVVNEFGGSAVMSQRFGRPQRARF
jgi:hypothetical protein